MPRKPASEPPGSFPERLAAFRKQRLLTEVALAELAGRSITQLERYESGASKPTLDLIRQLPRTLRTSADELLWHRNSRP